MFKKYYQFIIWGILLLFNILTVLFIGYLHYYESSSASPILEEEIISDKTPTIENKPDIKKLNVEIKGAVNRPGVYQVNSESIINDVIKLADGLKKDAYTKNINLSKHVLDEMVIYIYTKNEIAKLDEEKIVYVTVPSECKCPTYDINDCLNKGDSVIIPGEKEENNSSDEQKININTASIDELKKINGIGDSKAASIIKYREENGAFTKTEDIINVSGISQTLYEKIKDFITV